MLLPHQMDTIVDQFITEQFPFLQKLKGRRIQKIDQNPMIDQNHLIDLINFRNHQALQNQNSIKTFKYKGNLINKIENSHYLIKSLNIHQITFLFLNRNSSKRSQLTSLT
jgi:hypothetical protein